MLLQCISSITVVSRKRHAGDVSRRVRSLPEPEAIGGDGVAGLGLPPMIQHGDSELVLCPLPRLVVAVLTHDEQRPQPEEDNKWVANIQQSVSIETFYDSGQSRDLKSNFPSIFLFLGYSPSLFDSIFTHTCGREKIDGWKVTILSTDGAPGPLLRMLLDQARNCHVLTSKLLQSLAIKEGTNPSNRSYVYCDFETRLTILCCAFSPPRHRSLRGEWIAAL